MTIPEWNENYRVGVEELDEQHLRLLDIFYTLLNVGDTPRDSNKISEALASLKTYTYEHFRDEEEYMAQHGYPELESHRHIHDSFRKKVEDLCSVEPAKQKVNLTEILADLYDWLVTHLCSCDQLYVKYIASQTTSTV